MIGWFQSFLCFSLLVVSCWADNLDTLYLTWQHSPSSTMTLQWITSPQEKQTEVIYRQRKNEREWRKVSGESFPIPRSPEYLIHRVELLELQPDTEYIFKVIPYEDCYQFLTAPTNLEKELKFIVGGDMYDSLTDMNRTSEKAAQTNPVFAVIGGDIAYAVTSSKSTSEDIQRWIEWIKAWHKTMVTPQGNLIPVIAAIGNHDLLGQYDQTPTQAAVFSAFFRANDKKIYDVLDFSDYLSIVLLDSGHANPIGGEQTRWLDSVLKERQHIPHLFAIYHVPAYPSVRSFQTRQSSLIRHFWVSSFEKWGLQVAFEHHDHAYKRTYPLRKNRIHSQGVVYIGDGGWGVKTRPVRARPYIAKAASVRHFIAVSLTPFRQKFTSISEKGEIIDEFVTETQICQKTLNHKPIPIFK